MANQPNFLLGYGERLVEPITPVSGGVEKVSPYTLEEAKARLRPMLEATSSNLSSLSTLACPLDEAVALVTLHPQYLAKSYYPAKLLSTLGLDTVGSRPTTVKPAKWTRAGAPYAVPSTDLFVAGPRSHFQRWAQSISRWVERTPGVEDLSKIEHIRAVQPSDRIQKLLRREDEPVLEVVLHASGQRRSNFILEGFEAYLADYGFRADFDRRLHVGGLCFLPLQIPRKLINEIAKFSFLRVIREMPRIRTLRPIVRSTLASSFPCVLPAAGVVNTEVKVAVFDGGISSNSPLLPWVNPIDPPQIGAAVPEYQRHGHEVTSALLFGPLMEGISIDRPFSKVDHFRVLDEQTGHDPLELYDVLARIRSVLESRSYNFFNLSIGPELPIEDHEVHSWTAYFDQYLADHQALVTVAVGNGGRGDRESGNARIQVPADCVNALAVGASDSQTDNWRRADYSSIGPGRSPGVVKPDLLVFGGSNSELFSVVDPNSPTRSATTMGTSFASPAALRLGIGVQTILGNVVSPLAIKALLLHCADDESQNQIEHGWGNLSQSLDSLLTCPDTSARILYQGEMLPAQFVRAQIPLPSEELMGMVKIRATFCFLTDTDPQDPSNYTRSGLNIKFRPHEHKIEGKHGLAKTASFFQVGEYSAEQDLRQDAHKWETVVRREKSFRGSTLKNPVFDIHYNARAEGGPSSTASSIRYALVVSVESLRTADLYNRVVRRYATQLRPLVPVTQIPIRTRR